MKIKRLWAIVSTVLALAMLLPAIGCIPGSGPSEPGDNSPEPTDVPEPTPEPRSIKDQTAMASSIVYAADLLNGIQGFYDSPERQGFTVTNLKSQAHITLKDGTERGLTGLANANGVSLIEGGISGYVKTSDGFRFGTTASATARVNTNKMGVYYYEVNIRDLVFDALGLDSDSYTPVGDVDIPSSSIGEHDIKNLKVSGNSVSFTVESKSDPYIVLPLNRPLDGANTIVFEITSTGSASTGELFYTYDAGKSYSQSQKRSFKFNKGCVKQKVCVYVPDFDGYSGNIRGIRFDIDGDEGDQFIIENISIAKAPSYPAVKYGFEQTLHSYSDKLHSELRILYDVEVDGLAEFGGSYEVPKNTVEKMIIGMPGGAELDKADEVIEDFEYIGFDIKNAGIFGIIAENDGVTKTRITPLEDRYLIEIYIDVSGTHKKNSDSSFGHRIYADGRHSFDELKTEAYYERNPLTVEVTEQYTKQSKMKTSGYDTKTGAYALSLAGTDFSSAYRTKNRNNYFGGTVKVTASSDNRKIYFLSTGNNGCLEAAALLDDQNMLVPIQPEVCKNFQGEYEETYYDPKDTQWGVTVYPLAMEAGKDLTFTMLNLYQNWGANALKQISSISFHIGYYHLSTGVTESNCIAPYFVYGRDGWTLPDFRGCSGIMWSSQPQFNSVGRPGFLSFKDGSKVYQSEYTDSEIRSVGPVYSDLDYSYISYDGAIAYSLRHLEFPSDDENRTCYVMTGEVLKDVTYEDAKENFTLFYFDPRFQCMAVTKYKAEDGIAVELKNKPNGVQKEQIYKLALENPYFSLYDYNPKDGNDIENFGFIVKSFEMTVGGVKFEKGLVMRNSVFKDGAYLNKVEIGVDADQLAFKKGDTFKFVFILLPFGVKQQKNDDNVAYVIEDSVENPWRVASVATGKVIEDEYLAMVACVDDVAEFTVTGGRNANAVRVCGFSKLVRPKIMEKVGDQWVEYVYNVTDFDGYQVNYTSDGYFDYSFIVSMENFTDTRTFRVTVE